MFKLQKIDFNPLEGIERFASDNEKRGIPTEQEVWDLLNHDWDNYTAKLAFKVAALLHGGKKEIFLNILIR